MKRNLIAFIFCLTILPVFVFTQENLSVAKSLSEAVKMLQVGDFNGAEKLLLKTYELAPVNPDVNNLLGIIYDQKQNFELAERYYRNAIKLKPQAVSPRANLGILLSKTKREKEAIQNFESVLKIDPNHPQTIINIGLLYYSTGDFAKAIAFLEKAQSLDPESIDIPTKLGIAYYQTKSLMKAKALFIRLTQQKPDSAEFKYYLGLIEFSENNDPAAIEYFQGAAVDSFPDGYFMLGEVYAKQKRYAEAVSFYEKAIALDETKSAYFVRLGGTHLLLNDVVKAFEYFDRGAARFPQIAEIKYFLAIAMRAKGDYDAAIPEIKKALAIKETADSRALLGAMEADRNLFSEAEINFRKALSLNPDHFNSNYDLGRLLVKNGRFAEALPILQKAAAISPNSADLHYQLFLTFSRLKRKTEADRELALFKRLSAK